ncbi:hypothetical protein EOM57_05465 [Candidatus Saccharibacteria bacterium]|nr:hypothetical protein [Candidatus Saccharibacteria bacterium]
MAGLNVTLYVDEARYEQIRKGGFSKALGYWLWDTGFMGTPMDTGNARRNVVLRDNKPRHIRVEWDLFNANYVRFLEEGRGPVKKYKGFISVDIRGAMMEQVMSWLLTGEEPYYARRGITPFVALGVSKNKPFSMERSLLRQADMNANKITAKARQEVSRIRELGYSQGLIPQNTRGQRPDTQVKKGSRASYFNRNISQLHRIYLKQKEDIQYLT